MFELINKPIVKQTRTQLKTERNKIGKWKAKTCKIHRLNRPQQLTMESMDEWLNEWVSERRKLLNFTRFCLIVLVFLSFHVLFSWKMNKCRCDAFWFGYNGILDIWKMSLVICCQTIDHFQLQTNCNECISNANHQSLELLYFLCSFDDIFQSWTWALNMFYFSRTTFQMILQLIISNPYARDSHFPTINQNSNHSTKQIVMKIIFNEAETRKRNTPKERNEEDRNKTLINTKVQRQSTIIILIDFIKCRERQWKRERER